MPRSANLELIGESVTAMDHPFGVSVGHQNSEARRLGLHLQLDDAGILPGLLQVANSLLMFSACRP